MINHRSYSIIYKFQRIILLILFSTTAIALSIPLARLVATLSPDQFFPLAATLLIYLACMVVIGSVIHVVSYIPFNLASSFDPIKNRVASGDIKRLEELGSDISAFTSEFFNFSFLDIKLAFLHTDGSEPVSNQDISPLKHVIENFEMLEKSHKLEDITRAGSIELDNKKYQLYILPIWIGEKWLGYIGLLSKRRISRFFQKFLMEYENNFLDDQILIVMLRQLKG